MIKIFRHCRTTFKNATKLIQESEDIKILMGKILANQNSQKSPKDLSEVEFKVFSQNGEDGIIQYILNKINIPENNKIFIEFGVGDYYESNTRFLLRSNHWKGMVIEGSEKEVQRIKKHPNFWQYDLKIYRSFITTKNINTIISDYLETKNVQSDIGLLSIDIDGNDYWILKAIKIKPIIIICEYNVGAPNNYIQPYDENFVWDKKSAAGSSIEAIIELATSKGYKFIGCNSSKVNCFFVRNDFAERLKYFLLT